MEEYKKGFARVLCDSGALFFKKGLSLKDGRPTPYFVNTGNFAVRTSVRWELAKAFAGMIKRKIDEGMQIDIVFGPSYKASMIASDATIALYKEYGLDLGCSYDRKEIKDYGDGSLKGKMFVGTKFFDGCKIYLVDDVGTSMATKVEALEKIKIEADSLGIQAHVVGIGLAVDREQVGPVYDESKPETLSNKERILPDERGDDAIGDFIKKTGIPVDSVIGIKEAVKYVYEEGIPLMIEDQKQRMSVEVHDEFVKYMQKYGSER